MSELENKVEEYYENKILEMYRNLKLEVNQQVDVGELGREYQEKMAVVQTECYATTAYLNR